MKTLSRVQKCGVGLAILVGMVGGYLVWGVWAFDERIRVDDKVGLSEERIELLIKHACDVGAYPDMVVEHLRRRARWTPWRGASLFISIQGRANAVSVTAGFQGGMLYGGGRMFEATWNGAEWIFSEEREWVS